MSGRVIEQFTRDTLGCSCPDEVFRTVSVETNPPAFRDAGPARLLRIGGRLLVLLLELRGQDTLPLERLFSRGRQLRDAGGYNRFRLVVAAPLAMHPSLGVRFARLDGLDERLHLHLITPDQLPPALAFPQLCAVQQ